MKTILSLDGSWEFLLDPEARKTVMELNRQKTGWQVMPVPSAWEAYGVSKSYTGPVWYRKTFLLDRVVTQGSRYWLEFSGVSYYCEVWLNGSYVGSHQGSWDAFSLEVTQFLKMGENVLVVKVEKPGGRFPLRQSLAGFLPYVQGVMFGGIWQPVRLRQTGDVRIQDVFIKPDIQRGQITVDLSIDRIKEGVVPFQWTVRDPRGVVVSGGNQVVAADESELTWLIHIPQMQLWSLETPRLYTLVIRVGNGDIVTEKQTRFGMREITVNGSNIYLNGEYVFPRGVLHWGWYPDIFAPNPPVDKIREEITEMKQLGYNMIKHCLYVPVQDYFRLADEMGFLTWLELPMWQPEVTPSYVERTQQEYTANLKQVRNHPSILMYTIGCELNKEVPADFLQSLYNLVKNVTGSPLVRDNSGSAECYGGVNVEFADYYDHHFYAEPHLYRSLLDAFTARARGAKPWLFGEFCDCDTYRDLHEIIDHNGGELPWWMIADEDINPRGVRWEYSIVDHLNRIEKGNLRLHTAELVESSRRQAVAMRKLILETVRSYEEVSGYVILNISDTPLATPGMLDDLGRVKFSAEELTPFNNDSILVLGWDRRRIWKNGGDRPFFIDTYNYVSGSLVRARIAVAYGEKRSTKRAVIKWNVRVNGKDIAGGTTTCHKVINPGEVVELTVAEFLAPEVDVARQMILSAQVDLNGETTITNSWNLWVYPRQTTELDMASFGLYDPGFHLNYLQAEYPALRRVESPDSDTLGQYPHVITSTLVPELVAYIRRGGKVLLLVDYEEAVITKGVPFWRESLKLFGDHPIWKAIPHKGFSDTQFYGIATDRAFDPAQLRKKLGDHDRERPVLRRIDGRHLTVLDYIVEYRVGQGVLLATTLALRGGVGNQPSSFKNNVAGQYLFRAMVEYLKSQLQFR